MVNGVGVLGWGVGGIEAEACMLGQPLFLLAPVVVGVRFHNALPAGTTATDLVLTLTELLRKHGVVNKFVEFCGSGLTSMSVPDRATLSNMSPEFGATASLFPVDVRTLEYLRGSGRDAEHIDLVERYSKEQGMFRTDDSEIPTFSEMVELDLASVVPSVAGPKRPQDRVALPRVWESFCNVWAQPPRGANDVTAEGEISREEDEGGIDPAGMVEATTPNGPPDSALVRDGSVVIAAITSCTNTSNPAVMVAAGLLARNAVARGLMPPDYVKTSLAPGSRVVTDYLERAGLLSSLEQLRFNLVGYGCTTCIGNSGPLPELVAERIDSEDLTVAAVLSGNRNFEGRIHPQVRAAYLASPPLVVAYALAGHLDIDLTTEALGTGHDGEAVYLADIWPSADEVTDTVRAAIGSDLYTREYARIFDGDEHWQQLPSPTGALFDWDADSTYVREPPYFIGMSPQPSAPADVIDARVLGVFGDSLTTDHISPAGSISGTSPAAAYLREHGVEPRDFNTYGARRGNHDVMVRGTFANIRIHNQLADGKEGGWTAHLPDGAVMTIFEASALYQEEGIPLIIIGGREYGTGSSRDWAAKGPLLQGVRAVIAESYERIHRANLVGMGILPLQFRTGESAESLRLDGTELYTIRGVANAAPGATVHVSARRAGQADIEFETVCRLDSETDVEYLRNGGILPLVLRQLMGS
jgi:aconitate hydratase